jgi:18S rRNA (guanine1575-N7)-methyltransferase
VWFLIFFKFLFIMAKKSKGSNKRHHNHGGGGGVKKNSHAKSTGGKVFDKRGNLVVGDTTAAAAARKRIASSSRVASRPENSSSPDLFYDREMAMKYATNSRMMEVQAAMTERAIELLDIRPDEKERGFLILDIGAGSGLSGMTLKEKLPNSTFIGLDVSKDMLDIAASKRDDDDEEDDDDDEGGSSGCLNGDFILRDMGHGMGFLRSGGLFDYVISISAVQWLLSSDLPVVSSTVSESAAAANKQHCVLDLRPPTDPSSSDIVHSRLKRFFSTLYSCLRPDGGRAVLQFYPECAEHVERLTAAAMRAGFCNSTSGCGVVIDFPHSTKARKHYLVLTTSSGATSSTVPAAITENKRNRRHAAVESDEEEDDEAMDEDDEEGEDNEDGSGESDEDEEGSDDEDDDDDSVDPEERARIRSAKRLTTSRTHRRLRTSKLKKGSRAWILAKKAQQRVKFGVHKVRKDTKYTGRKRNKPRF